jgi:hypothetical protein
MIRVQAAGYKNGTKCAYGDDIMGGELGAASCKNKSRIQTAPEIYLLYVGE